ncbi:hypothetical protein CALCODRAFT_170376 [Calocera cornea HHB12733]|uniref:Uncharacterized protein n=1 Tax=Calocera cornea HHB12733 TaxID=1353952 RepID=A0A165CFJ9_9BASI|nr:hypothetical protein CALCODRAFT_170376 [Calocera cornea HHB12733]
MRAGGKAGAALEAGGGLRKQTHGGTGGRGVLCLGTIYLAGARASPPEVRPRFVDRVPKMLRSRGPSGGPRAPSFRSYPHP